MVYQAATSTDIMQHGAATTATTVTLPRQEGGSSPSKPWASWTWRPWDFGPAWHRSMAWHGMGFRDPGPRGKELRGGIKSNLFVPGVNDRRRN